MPRAPLALLVLAAACWVEEDGPADVCIEPHHDGIPPDSSGETKQYVADRPVDVVLQWWLSDDETRDIRCSLARDGNDFTVDGSFERNTRKLGDGDILRSALAICITEPLPAGDYTFTHHDETLTLTVPSSVPAPCIIQPTSPPR